LRRVVVDRIPTRRASDASAIVNVIGIVVGIDAFIVVARRAFDRARVRAHTARARVVGVGVARRAPVAVGIARRLVVRTNERRDED
jgi:hypothetical protein